MMLYRVQKSECKVGYICSPEYRRRCSKVDTDDAVQSTEVRVQGWIQTVQYGVQKTLFKGGYRWRSMKYRGHPANTDGAVRSTDGTGQGQIHMVQNGVQYRGLCSLVDTYDAVLSTEVRVQGWIQMMQYGVQRALLNCGYR
jgi:hypothetical protein